MQEPPPPPCGQPPGGVGLGMDSKAFRIGVSLMTDTTHGQSGRRTALWFGAAAAAAALCGSAAAQTSESLGRYFGFDQPRMIAVDDRVGPAAAADFDADGRTDLCVVNNAKSRIEIYRQRAAERSDSEMEKQYKVNELPPNRWYDRIEVSVAHRVAAFRAHDVDRDGRLDIVYAGDPAEIVVLRQKDTLTFETGGKRRVRGLAAGQDGFEIADVMGSSEPELLAIVDGKIAVWSLTTSGIGGEPLELGSGAKMLAFFVEDYNGDGLADVLGIIPDDPSPLRLWLQGQFGASNGGKSGQLGAEVRLEMPALIEAEPIRFPPPHARAAASIGVIERASRRMVLYDLTTEQVSDRTDPGADRAGELDASPEVFALKGGANRERSIVVADVDGDGLLDILATDPSANSIVLYRQESGVGIGAGTSFSAFKKPKTVAAGQWDTDAPLEVFVLSEEEKAVGVSDYDPSDGTMSFPQPLSIKTAGASPVAMNFVMLKEGPAVAVVVKDKRDHTLEIHRPGGEDGIVATTVVLEGVNRPPQSMISGDFDHDGATDLLLFTPNEPLVMVRSVGGTDGAPPVVLTDKSMPQFGLVQSAGPDNTAGFDADGDGFDELLIANENFVRACTFSADKGWRVVEQATMPDSSSRLVGLTVQTGPDGTKRIAAADKANERLIIMSRGDDGWIVDRKLRLSGIDVNAIAAGSFTGDGSPGIVCFSPDAFGVVRLGGQRLALEEFAAYRSDADDRLEHEMEVGDVNGDGFVDLIVLDAREQMCTIFTLSAARKLHHATEFKVFESRLFSRGESREFEPSAAIIADLTGDGADDLVLEVHDRYMILPQMTGR